MPGRTTDETRVAHATVSQPRMRRTPSGDIVGRVSEPWQKVRETIARELDEDYVEVWKIAWHLRRLLPTASDIEVEEEARLIISGLCASGVLVGDLTDEGFVAWDRHDSVDEVIRRWHQLGRDPTIGEVAWLMRP